MVMIEEAINLDIAHVIDEWVVKNVGSGATGMTGRIAARKQVQNAQLPSALGPYPLWFRIEKKIERE